MEKVTIVIAHHTGSLIYKCLLSLSDVTAEKIVITSDLNFKLNGSLMENVKLYKTLINEPTHKRNYAARQAKGQYFAFFDDDIEIFPDCVDKMTDYLDKHQDVGMVYALLIS